MSDNEAQTVDPVAELLACREALARVTAAARAVVEADDRANLAAEGGHGDYGLAEEDTWDAINDLRAALAGADTLVGGAGRVGRRVNNASYR